MVKFCLSCKIEYPIDHFVRCSPDKTKFRPYCKSCRSEKKKAYRISENGRLKTLQYSQSQKFKENLKKYQESPKGKASLKRNYAKTKLNGRKKARWTVGNAIRSGKLKRSYICSNCGKKGKTHFHHYMGYDDENLLKVKEICPPCHGKEHANL